MKKIRNKWSCCLFGCLGTFVMFLLFIGTTTWWLTKKGEFEVNDTIYFPESEMYGKFKGITRTASAPASRARCPRSTACSSSSSVGVGSSATSSGATATALADRFEAGRCSPFRARVGPLRRRVRR